ncbi:hypothetical protein HXP44_32760 [Streptomyces sioyaensis]|uniref:Uncharacterized protein n=1 Tax=Streptomyces sioyaensis TaxID=67364 RepID=A0A4Q1RCM5_9ACTN|nr:hypothetical protein [Streptomyces sioyaensis]MBM4796671.1 hypothetical protein [Streptomyces sioyaensis]RXS71578.1 hypothetical protein EST54_00640 [Streptomyces sioyaensis]
MDGSPAGLAAADWGAREAQLRTELARRPDARELPLVVDHFKELIKAAANDDFPQDPARQLQRAGHAVKHFARAEMRRFGNDELDSPDLIRYSSGLIARLAPVTYRQFLGYPGRTSRQGVDTASDMY